LLLFVCLTCGDYPNHLAAFGEGDVEYPAVEPGEHVLIPRSAIFLAHLAGFQSNSIFKYGYCLDKCQYADLDKSLDPKQRHKARVDAQQELGGDPEGHKVKIYFLSPGPDRQLQISIFKLLLWARLDDRLAPAAGPS
jgi:hypothetical protein